MRVERRGPPREVEFCVHFNCSQCLSSLTEWPSKLEFASKLENSGKGDYRGRVNFKCPVCFAMNKEVEAVQIGISGMGYSKYVDEDFEPGKDPREVDEVGPDIFVVVAVIISFIIGLAFIIS